MSLSASQHRLPRRLGLPDSSHACLFDLDGLLTKTVRVHAAMWKEMFDAYLRDWSGVTGQPFAPFVPIAGYDTYVRGKPRTWGSAFSSLPVFGDTLADVAAGRASRFGYVVGLTVPGRRMP